MSGMTVVLILAINIFIIYVHVLLSNLHFLLHLEDN